ncbi:TOBE domain-containing protein [Nonomuraea ferruginea]
MNVLDGAVASGLVRVGDAAVGRASGDLPPGPVRIGVRPEFVRLTSEEAPPGIAARVTGIDRMGAYDLVHAQVNGHPLVARTDAAAVREPGSVTFLRFAEGRAFLFRDAVRCGVVEPLPGSAP